MMQNFEQIFAKLVSFQTVSETSNKNLVEFIHNYLKKFQLNPKKILGDDGRFNLICQIGPSSPGGLVLSGHTDVVPVIGQKWGNNPFNLINKNGNFFGRGACDMKGFIATVLSMVPLIMTKKLVKPIFLIFSYDEEVGCIGIQKLIPILKKIKPKPSFCIVGEPTEMKIVNKHKGKKNYEILLSGIEAHSSLTKDGVNAIEYSGEIIEHLKNLQENFKKDFYDADFEPPFPTVNIGTISGGTAVNIIPNKCSLEFEIRDTPKLSQENIDNELELLKKITEKKMKRKNQKCLVELIKKNNFPPLQTDSNKKIISMSMKSLQTNLLNSVSFGTEAGVFHKLGIQTIVCGPGSIKQAHKPDEFIKKNQISKCEVFLNNFIDNLNSC